MPESTAVGVPSLSPADRLALWEDASDLHPIDRALAILARAHPATPPGAFTRLPLGERDSLLLGIRRHVLGDHLSARYACPHCGENLEWGASCTTLIDSGHPPEESVTWTLTAGEYLMTLRSLDSLDAAAAARSGTATEARDQLLGRAVVSAERAGASVAARTLPPALIARVAESLAEHDPGAEFLLSCVCPACGLAWDEELDVASFVADELAATGRALLDDVDVIARAYGWSEVEILALSDRRRRAYVGLAGG